MQRREFIQTTAALVSPGPSLSDVDVERREPPADAKRDATGSLEAACDDPCCIYHGTGTADCPLVSSTAVEGYLFRKKHGREPRFASD